MTMICRARRKRAWLVSHSRLVGLGVWLKPGRSWFDSRGWDEGSPDAATRCPRRSATPMAALAITKQACRGDRPVRHTDLGRFDSGRLLRTCDLEGEECSRVARTAAEVRVTRRTSNPTRVTRREPNAAVSTRRRQGARCATRTQSRLVAALPGPSCPRTIRPPFPRRVDVVHPRISVRNTGSFPRWSWWSCHADLARASCTAQQCEGAAP